MQALVFDHSLDHAQVVVERDPAPPLSARSERPAETETKQRQELAECAALPREHDPGPQVHDTDATLLRGRGRGLPITRERREPALPRFTGLDQHRVATIAVVADAGGRDQELGWSREPGEPLAQET